MAVDVNLHAVFNARTFTSIVQNENRCRLVGQRRDLCAYSGHAGDCGLYRGWVVGVPINNPASVTAWATDVIAAGYGQWRRLPAMAPPFHCSGNTFNTAAMEVAEKQ